MSTNNQHCFQATLSRASLLTFVLVSAWVSIWVGGCQSSGTPSAAAPTSNKAFVTEPAVITGEILCPITGEVVTVESPAAMYGVFPVYCATREDAAQFASLPKGKRAKLGAAQVLPQKRILNTTCPLTGEELTAMAAPALFEGQIIGFASIADANQFMSLPVKKRQELIAAWRTSAPNEKTAQAT